jgi:hypothetical protein
MMDTPATIAILGAGPIGLEAALYARFLGYDVRIYERGRVADSVLRWGHVRMFTPFAMNCSTLGLAALAAQDPHYRPPDEAVCPAGREWAERYLLPLAETDLLADHVLPHTSVLAVSRWNAWKGQWLGDDARRTASVFRILVRDAGGVERADSADIVLDASGVYGQPNWLGPGGTPAVGERALRDVIEYALPDVMGRDRKAYAGARTLLVGTGYSAATTAVGLAQLAREAPGTRITWVTRPCTAAAGPIFCIPDDTLPERKALATRANELTDRSDGPLLHLPGWQVDRVDYEGDRFSVVLRQDDSGELRTEVCDRIVANVGFRGDNSLFAELHVHQCYASEGPMKLAAALLGAASQDCLTQPATGSSALLTPEPNFYLLGSKSYGRNSKFLYSSGLRQIRDLFAVIGGRAELDLYNFNKKLPP